MTLKTSLIITGDSSTAQTAVEELRESVDKLGTGSRATATAQGALTTATNATNASARGAIVAQTGAAAASTAVAATSRVAAAAQGALAVGTNVASGALASFGVTAMSVEAILTGGLSLAITAGIAFLTGFASEAINGSFALDEQGDSARALAQETEALNKALEQEAQTQHTASVRALAHADAQRALAIETVKARKALLEGAITEAEQRRGSVKITARGDVIDPGYVRATREVERLKAEVDAANRELAEKNKTVALRRGYFVDRGIEAATDPRARIDLTYDQRRTRLDQQRGSLGETRYARERIQLDQQRAASIDALSQAETRATGSIRALGAARSSASAIDRDATQAQKQLKADLTGVIGRYDPARKAASDYADELERIAKLEKGGKISPEDAGGYRAQASAGYLGQVIDWGSIKPQADDEKKVIDAAGAIGKIVQSIEDETAALTALTPLQRVQVQYRKELAELAPKEREAAAQRIADAQAEKDATEDIKRATEDAQRAKEQLAQAAVDAFTAIAVGGQKASDVISHLAGSIASAAIEATLFGTGPMAALLNGSIAPGTPSGGGPSGVPGDAADLIGKSVGKELEGRLDRIFGEKGSFGTTLKNAGLGYAAGGVTGSRTGGAVGGAIGGYVGKEVLGSALGSLGQFAGPIGAIAGGLLGGVIGGLFKKTPKASATVTGVDDEDLSVSGNNGSAKKRAVGLGGSVQDTVQDIAAALGGELGKFAVSIGTYKDEIRVDTTGSGRTKGYTKSETTNETRGLYNFRDDEASAVAFAALDAIADGGIKGLSEKVQKALKSSSDLEKALEEAFSVQEIETMLGGIASEMASQFKSLETQAKERVRIATEYGFDVVAIEKKNAEDRVKLVDQILADRVGSLQSLLTDLDYGSLAEGSIMDQRAKLLSEIAKARGDAEAGVDGAADKLATLSRSLVDLSRENLGTAGGEYAADRSTAAQAAQAVIAAEKSRVSAAQGAQAATNAKLDDTNQTLDELATQQSQTNATLDAILAAIKAGGTTVTAGGGGSSMVSDWYRTQAI